MPDRHSIANWAAKLLGEVDRDGQGNRVIRCPGPGHSPDDRSLSVWLDEDDPEGFRVHSFAPKDDDCNMLPGLRPGQGGLTAVRAPSRKVQRAR